ncbi:hypothetical protein CI102_13812 [Trichoderma harzianum]|nr:hypothetical protein CI102_13812 [Trichoderma harzianum]
MKQARSFAQPASAVLSWPVHVVSCHFTWGIVDEWNLMHIHSVKYGALIPIRGTTTRNSGTASRQMIASQLLHLPRQVKRGVGHKCM